MADEGPIVPPPPPPKPSPFGDRIPLLFGKYEFTGVVVSDPGLVKYINLDPVIVPHTGARHGNTRFAKHKMNLVERVVNEMMRTENWTGKKSSSYRAVRDAFDIVAEKTKQNPIQVLVKAIESAAPREEVTRLRYGGISVPKAVDVSPARRLDVALRNMTSGAVASSHKSKNSIASCLAEEILKASKGDLNSFAVGKKEEVERVAKSAR
ncbi:MAG: 30S ribosomal protein S7 [Thermoplasmatota archaeon]